LNGEYPDYKTFSLKNRLIIEGIFKNKCNDCGTEE
jgi:hypothetical protein